MKVSALREYLKNFPSDSDVQVLCEDCMLHFDEEDVTLTRNGVTEIYVDFSKPEKKK